jgi:phosphoadenosine phosphosulfate reductase
MALTASLAINAAPHDSPPPPLAAVDLSALTAALNARFADAQPVEILRAAVTELFPGRIALVSSFGAESALLLHLLSEVDRNTPVLFLDTGKHFIETLMYRDILGGRFDLTDMRALEPDAVAIAAADPDGTLWSTNPDLCCQLRKVDPLVQGLAPFDAWITGRKRYQSTTRAALPLFEALDGRIKVNPLAQWNADQIQVAFKQLKLPQHPLVDEGFKSIGCKPCTIRTAEGGDARSGRWAGLEKTECGIHRN